MSASLVIRHENAEFEFRFTRRRYGNTTYTWVEVLEQPNWLSLGDPWPCVTPKRSELIKAAQEAISSRA